MGNEESRLFALRHGDVAVYSGSAARPHGSMEMRASASKRISRPI